MLIITIFYVSIRYKNVINSFNFIDLVYICPLFRQNQNNK